MGFSNLLSSALTAVATLSGDPDMQRTANSANDLVVSYQTQQQQAMAERILNSPEELFLSQKKESLFGEHCNMTGMVMLLVFLTLTAKRNISFKATGTQSSATETATTSSRTSSTEVCSADQETR